MPQVEVNYLAVLVAAIASMVLGALWYSPMLFGSKWVKLMGWTQQEMEKRKKGMGKSYGIAFVGSLVMAYVLAIFIAWAGAASVAAGVQVGFWVWLGFLATTGLGTILWEGRPKELYAINTGYELVQLLVMGAILAVWK